MPVARHPAYVIAGAGTRDGPRPWGQGPSNLDQAEGSVDAVTTLDRVTQSRSLVGGHLDDETPATLKGHPQHDAAALLDDLERAIAGPRLHCCHGSPSLGILGLWPHYSVSRLRDLIGDVTEGTSALYAACRASAAGRIGTEWRP